MGLKGSSQIPRKQIVTAASWLVMGGKDLYAVGQLLGHRTPRMTQRYAHLSPSHMAGAIGKLDLVFERRDAGLRSSFSPVSHARVTTFWRYRRTYA